MQRTFYRAKKYSLYPYFRTSVSLYSQCMFFLRDEHLAGICVVEINWSDSYSDSKNFQQRDTYIDKG